MSKADAGSLLDRVLPHNHDAERAVLGALLVNNAVYAELAATLRPADFYRHAHAAIYRAISELLERSGGSADLLTVRDALSRAGTLEQVGGPAYVASLVDGVPRAVNARHYAGIVRQKAQLRRLIAMADHIQMAAYEDERDPEEILADADRGILQLRHGAGSSRTLSLMQSSDEWLADLEWRASHRGELIGVGSGYPSIDALTNGWQAGDLIILAARPSIGKTTLAINTAAAVASTARADGTGRVVLVFSLEMRRKQLEYRLLAAESGVDLSRLLSGYLTPEEWKLIAEANARVRARRIVINDQAGLTVWDMRAEARRVKAEAGLDLLVIDYMQLVAGSLERRGATRTEEMTDISRRCKVMADELSVPIIAVSQLSRANQQRDDPRPKLSDLRESGALEQDADIVGFLHRRHHREGGTTQFILEKQRNGPTGTVNLTLHRECVRFDDGGDDPPPEPEPAAKPRQVSFLHQRRRSS